MEEKKGIGRKGSQVERHTRGMRQEKQAPRFACGFVGGDQPARKCVWFSLRCEKPTHATRKVEVQTSSVCS